MEEQGRAQGPSLDKSEVLDDVLETVPTPVYRYSIDCSTPEDEEKSSLYAVWNMEVDGFDTVIVTDGNNKCVKSFYKQGNDKKYSRLSMKSQPASITKIGDKKIAVALPGCKEIAVVSVTPELTLDSTISTQKEYWGLTSLTPTTLAAGCKSPSCVDILDMSGNVLQSINPLQNEENIIQQPIFLCTTKQGNILISDRGTRSVLCVTLQGEVLFNYSFEVERELETPRGIISTAVGHILVVDWWTHKMLQLTESGEFVRDILTEDSLLYPLGIDWDERGILYVSRFDNGASVQVFTLK